MHEQNVEARDPNPDRSDDIRTSSGVMVGTVSG